MCVRKPAFAGVFALVVALAGCAGLTAAIARFEERADPVIQAACAGFRQAETSPLVRLALAGGTMAANAATGGAAGPIVALLHSYGDAYCSAGPPAGDTTTPMQQRNWLLDVMKGMLETAHGMR
jgi:hypothetical protein